MYVVNVTDTVLSQLMEKCNIIAENNVIRKVFFGVSKVLALKQPDFLKELCNHNANTDEISSHKTRMIEKIVSCYATLRLKHYCKLKTTTFHRKKIRRYYNKLILFKNQQYLLHYLSCNKYIVTLDVSYLLNSLREEKIFFKISFDIEILAIFQVSQQIALSVTKALFE